jgi:hypothetical protein
VRRRSQECIGIGAIAHRSVETTADVMDDGEEKDSVGAYSPRTCSSSCTRAELAFGPVPSIPQETCTREIHTERRPTLPPSRKRILRCSLCPSGALSVHTHAKLRPP